MKIILDLPTGCHPSPRISEKHLLKQCRELSHIRGQKQVTNFFAESLKRKKALDLGQWISFVITYMVTSVKRKAGNGTLQKTSKKV